jgi:hypothetical protein
MLSIPTHSKAAGEALIFGENSDCIQWPENNQELSSRVAAAAGTIQI